MRFDGLKILDVFNYAGKYYIKIGDYTAFDKDKNVEKFNPTLDVNPVTLDFKVSFIDIISQLELGQDFQYNGMTYKKIDGYRQALNMSTFAVETFI